MIKAGETFELMDDDGYHIYPGGHFKALRDITPEEVVALMAKDALNFESALCDRGFAIEVSMPSILTDYDVVNGVGTWKRDG